MPRLVYRGNTIDNFGRFLPAPYIDKVIVNDDYFEITLALFVEVEEDEELTEGDEDDILTDLNLGELTYCLVVAPEANSLTLEALKSKEIDIFSVIYTAKYMEYMRSYYTSESEDDYFYIRPWYGPDLRWPNDMKQVDNWDASIDGAGDVTNYWAYRREYEQPLLTPDAPAIMTTFSLDDFEYASTTYTEEGKKVLKFVAFTTDNGDTDDVFTEFFTNSYVMSDDFDSYDEPPFTTARIENWENINVYAFSTIYDIDELDSDAIEEYTETKSPSLLHLNTSAISYEHVIRDGVINTRPEVAWLDKAGEPYDQIPLQSVNSQYYTADNITHADIVAHFEELVSEYQSKAAKPGHSALESALNNISYVLAVYGEDAELLPRLNLLRKTFSSKSTATEVGRLYVRFRKRIYNTNLTVVKERRLIKQLIINPKLVDNRTVPIDGWEWAGTWEFPFADGSAYAKEALYGNWSVSVEETANSSEDYSYNLISKGFFWFDYEKVALSSSVSQIYDVLKLQTYFGGQAIINEKLTIDTVRLYRGPMDPDDADGDGDSDTLDDLDETGSWQVMLFCETADTDEDGEDIETIQNVPNRSRFYSMINELVSVNQHAMSSYGSYKSYLYPRSFNTPDGSLGDYRLMCYEFQDIFEGSDGTVAWSEDFGVGSYYNMVEDEEGQPQPGWGYKAVISIDDYTLDIAVELISNYGNEMTNFETYYEAASEACNYNSIDGVFNQFFIDAMENEYGDDLTSAPWVLMPLIFCIHLDLIVNTFNGDYDLTMEAARAMSTKVSPYTGTLEAVTGFYNAIIDLKETYYPSWEHLEGLEPGDDIYSWFSQFSGNYLSNMVGMMITQENSYPGNTSYDNEYSRVFDTEGITIATEGDDIETLSDLETYHMPMYKFVFWDFQDVEGTYGVSPSWENWDSAYEKIIYAHHTNRNAYDFGEIDSLFSVGGVNYTGLEITYDGYVDDHDNEYATGVWSTGTMDTGYMESGAGVSMTWYIYKFDDDGDGGGWDQWWDRVYNIMEAIWDMFLSGDTDLSSDELGELMTGVLTVDGRDWSSYLTKMNTTGVGWAPEEVVLDGTGGVYEYLAALMLYIYPTFIVYGDIDPMTLWDVFDERRVDE